MNDSGLYIHRFLRCQNACAIPLPHSTPEETDSNLLQRPTDNRQIVFVCPYCGLGSAYSGQDVFETAVAGKQSLFQQRECLLVSIEIECDGQDCEAPKVIHTLQGVETGTWKPTAAVKDWQYSETALCGAGHRLRCDLGEVHQITRIETLF
jgi:hypothetical protein